MYLLFVQALLAKCEIEYEKEVSHMKFCGSMEKTCEISQPNRFLPLPPSIIEGNQQRTIVGVCTGCGLPFDDTALDAFSLPCCHVYHMLCFAHVCRDVGFCVAMDCHQEVPARAKRMMGQMHITVKKEQSSGKLIACCIPLVRKGTECI